MPEILEKNKLGTTNLMVTPICVGGAPFGNLPKEFGYEVSEEQAIATVKRVFESGINFLDTANLYGRSEERIGKAIRELGGLPKDMIIATKADRDPSTNDASADQIESSVENSLKLLGLDYLPLVYLHDPEFYTQNFDEVMGSNGAVARLHKLKDQGIIGNIGISGGPAEMLIRYVNTGAFTAVITHNRYTILNRNAQELINIASEKGLGVVNAAVFGSGVLVKGSSYPKYAYRVIPPDLAEKVKGIEKLCQEYSVPMGAVALQFSLRNPKIHSTVAGVASPQEVDQLLSFAKVNIPDELWSQVDQFKTDKDPES